MKVQLKFAGKKSLTINNQNVDVDFKISKYNGDYKNGSDLDIFIS